MAIYRYGGKPGTLASAPIFNNSFHIIDQFSGQPSFSEMTDTVFRSKNRYLNQKSLNFHTKTFRVRFVRENRFEKVETRLTAMAESEIKKALRLSVDRVNPDTEFWYVIRRENTAFYAQLLSKRAYTEKNLNKGELRPEVALLTAYWSRIHPSDVVLDPFAGYGSIPLQIYRHIPFHKLIVSDIDREKSDHLRRLFKNAAADVSVSCADFFQTPDIPDKSVDKIITDPPWGMYDEIVDIPGFYTNMLRKMSRLMKDNGDAVILTSGKEELMHAALACGFYPAETTDTLINGKKARLFRFILKTEQKDYTV
jgi:tRNA G10  N-methylase Trm11